MASKLSRRKISGYIADGLTGGGNLKKLINELAGYLIESKRTKELELIVRDIEFQLQDRGMVLANVTSAFSLTEQTRKAVESLIKTHTDAKQISLRQFIDPTVLGGVKVNLPGQQLDTTIASRLTKLKTQYRK